MADPAAGPSPAMTFVRTNNHPPELSSLAEHLVAMS